MVTTGIIAYAITGSLDLAGSIAVAEGAIKYTLFYYHDSLWDSFNSKRLEKAIDAGDTSSQK